MSAVDMADLVPQRGLAHIAGQLEEGRTDNDPRSRAVLGNRQISKVKPSQDAVVQYHRDRVWILARRLAPDDGDGAISPRSPDAGELIHC
jgi:hypothetical protein